MVHSWLWVRCGKHFWRRWQNILWSIHGVGPQSHGVDFKCNWKLGSPPNGTSLFFWYGLTEIMVWMSHYIRSYHDDVIKWKHFPRYWPFVRGIHRLPANSPHKGQWRRALIFSLICARINGWVNNRESCDLRRRRVHYDVNVMIYMGIITQSYPNFGCGL